MNTSKSSCASTQLFASRLIRLVSTIDLSHVAEEIEDTARVAPLVVIPGDQLDEVLVQADTGLGVEDGRVDVAVQVGGDDLVLGVGEYA